MMVKACLAIGAFATALALPAQVAAQVSRVGSTFPVWAAPTRGSAVAYDSKNDVYLVVSAAGTLRGRFISADGAPLADEFVIQTSTNYTHFPRVAYSPDADSGAGGFLVTWHESDQGNNPTSVHCRVVSFSHGPVGADIQVPGSSSFWEVGAAVAYSTASREFLITWRSFAPADIYAVRVDLAGTPIGAVVPVSSAAAHEDNPNVAYNSQSNEYFIVHTSFTSFSELLGRRIEAGTGRQNGAVVIAQTTGIYITDVAYNSLTGQYLAAWYQDPPRALYGRLLNADGTPAGNINALSSRYAAYDGLSVGHNRTSGTFFAISHDLISVAAGGSAEDGGVEISAGATPLTTGIQVTAAGGTGNFYPRITAHISRPEWLVVTAGSFTTTLAQRLQTATRDIGGTPAPPAPPPTPSCAIAINDNTTSISGTVYSATLAVTTGAGCSWSVISQASWLSASPTGGSGSGSIQWNAQPNTGAARTGTIVIAGATASRTLTVNQAGGLVTRLGDFDGDSRIDLIWQNLASGDLALWRMNGFNMMSGDSLSPARVGDTGWKIVAALDVDKDGSTDLLWQHDTGYLSVWRMRGGTLVAGELITERPLSDTRWRVVGAGDMDRDGNADILFQHQDGRVAVWYMRGTTFLSGEVIAESLSDQAWRIVGMTDMNGDGNLDLVWHHRTAGQVAVWLMHRMRLRDAILLNDSAPDTNWRVRALGDFDSDGDVDLLWQNDATGGLAAWIMNGLSVQNGMLLNTSVPDRNWKIVAPR